MLFLFKRKRNHKQDRQDAKQDKLAEWVVKRFLIAQHKASKVLQDKFEMLSITAKRFVVVAFCVVSFSSCVFLILKGFSIRTDKPFSITTISLPKQTGSALQPNQASDGVSKTELEKIIRFRDYLDTLPKSQSGKRILDSILINRSGLIDSLTLIEKMYHLQSPNK